MDQMFLCCLTMQMLYTWYLHGRIESLHIDPHHPTQARRCGIASTQSWCHIGNLWACCASPARRILNRLTPSPDHSSLLYALISYPISKPEDRIVRSTSSGQQCASCRKTPPSLQCLRFTPTPHQCRPPAGVGTSNEWSMAVGSSSG